MSINYMAFFLAGGGGLSGACVGLLCVFLSSI